MFGWVFDVPLWIMGPALVLVLSGISVAGLLLVRGRILPRLRMSGEESHFIGTMVHSIMVFYGLVLALIAVNVFETYSKASEIVSAEASAIAMLYRDTNSFPEPARSGLRSALREYVEYTIHEAWPVQRTGRVPASGVARIDSVQARLAAFEPSTEGQKILHAEAWRTYNHAIETRRARLEEVTKGLPGVMWMVVLLGAAISIAGAAFFRVGDARLHAILVTLLATFIASVIFIVLAMDRPFRGDLGISAEPYELIYNHLMKH